MRNSRRGFIASLLALIPLARTSNATTIFSKLSTIRIINTHSLPGSVAVAPVIVSTRQFRAINAGATLDFTGVPGLAIALSALDFKTGAIIPLTYTSFPAKGTVIVYNLVFDPTAGTTTLVLAAPTTT